MEHEQSQIPKTLEQDFRIRVIMSPGREHEYSEHSVMYCVDDFLRNLSIGETLSHTLLSVAILIKFSGIVNIHVQVPSEDVVPAPDVLIVAGKIEVFRGGVDDLNASLNSGPCRIHDVIIVGSDGL